MPSSIPYSHPSLVLGSIVSPPLLDKLRQISVLQAQIDAAQDKMNAYISMKRSLDMTANELLGMNVDITALTGKAQEVDQLIAQTAAAYAGVRLSAEAGLQALKEQVAETAPGDSPESPLNFEQTGIRKMPLAADALQLDAQYFSYDGNEEDNPFAVSASIENYVRASTAGLGERTAAGIGNAAAAQISLQRKNHSLTGTLVITASCTHKQAVLLSPFVLDIDKAVSVWNTLGSNANNQIDTTDPTGLRRTLAQENDAPGTGMSILSGVTCGSAFVGMVHILRQDATGNAGPSMTSVAAGLQERFKVGSWFEESSGGFGVDPSFSTDIKNLLSTQRITTHVNLVVSGVIPSIRSNLVEMGVKTFADTDADKISAGLAAVARNTDADASTVDQAAATAKTGARAMALQSASIQSVMTGLGKIDQAGNQVMDINTLMNAFEDYLSEVKKGDTGIPITFQVKTVTRRELVKQWLNKYYPQQTASPDKNPAP